MIITRGFLYYSIKTLTFLTAGQTRLGLSKAWYGNYNNQVTELGNSSGVSLIDSNAARIHYYKNTQATSYDSGSTTTYIVAATNTDTLLDNKPHLGNVLLARLNVTGTATIMYYTSSNIDVNVKLTPQITFGYLNMKLTDYSTTINLNNISTASDNPTQITFTYNYSVCIDPPDFYLYNNSIYMRFINDTRATLISHSLNTYIAIYADNRHGALYMKYKSYDVTFNLYTTYVDI